jgi:uncharacterized circularly permuted ATP-grasp superfamily protein
MTDSLEDASTQAVDVRMSRLLPDYLGARGHFDELRAPDGTLRPSGTPSHRRADLSAASCAQAKPAHRAADRRERRHLQRLRDRSGSAEAVGVDVLPMVIRRSNGSALERGLRQRARLLNSVAADLYGSQSLIRDGLIPPALVFRHSGFLRACHGVRPPNGTYLHVAAFDLARGPDGRWRVVGTRAQAPSGLGYSLENRAIVSRLFPDAYRSLGIQPLAPFFHLLRETLSLAAPAVAAFPIVLLTPGPACKTY